MNTRDKVQDARSPYESLLAIAESLDRIEAKFEMPTEPLAPVDWKHEWVDIIEGPIPTEDGDTVIHEIAPVSADKEALRRQWAEALRVHELLSDVANPIKAYAKGGPQWLYGYDRDAVMSLPLSARRAMVEDLREEDPKAAYEMARDVLKDTSPGELPADWVK